MRKPLNLLTGVMTVVGRLLLCSVFLAAAAGFTAPDVHGVADAIATKAAMAPAWTLVAGTVILCAGSLSVVLGYKARIGALALLVFMAISTWLFHGFTIWNMLNRQARHDHVAHLLMNMSIMGAMLFIVANGAGQMSVDGPRR